MILAHWHTYAIYSCKGTRHVVDGLYTAVSPLVLTTWSVHGALVYVVVFMQHTWRMAGCEHEDASCVANEQQVWRYTNMNIVLWRFCNTCCFYATCQDTCEHANMRNFAYSNISI